MYVSAIYIDKTMYAPVHAGVAALRIAGGAFVGKHGHLVPAMHGLWGPLSPALTLLRGSMWGLVSLTVTVIKVPHSAAMVVDCGAGFEPN